MTIIGLMKTLIHGGALGALLLLFGCGGPQTLGVHRVTPVSWSSMIYAAKDGPILVEVPANPFGGSPAPLAPLVAQAMTGAVIGYPTTFSADRNRVPRPGYRTVMVFQPAPGLDDFEVCAGNLGFVAGQPPGRVSLFGVFCNNARPLISVKGAVSDVTGPGDPRFLALVRQATTDLFRRPTEDDFGGDDFESFLR